MKISTYILAAALLFSACNTENISQALTQKKANGATLHFTAAKVELHTEAGDESVIVATLAKTDSVFYLNNYSSFSSKQTLYGIVYDEPWLQVRTADGKEGWVYGGMVKMDKKTDSDDLKLLLQRRCATFFGQVLADKIATHNEILKTAKTQEQFAAFYATAMLLRDALTQKIADQVSKSEQIPDLFWLEACIKGFVPQLSEDGKSYHLYTDYNVFSDKAARTTGEADEQFFRILLLLYPEDGIEYSQKSYSILYDDAATTPASLLGEGKHLQLLTAADAALRRSAIFQKEILSLKKEIVDDIMLNTKYWQVQDKIIQEIDDILATRLGTILTDNDKNALRIRRVQFINSDKNHLQLNMREG